MQHAAMRLQTAMATITARSSPVAPDVTSAALLLSRTPLLSAG